VEEGADLVVDGRGLRVAVHENGFFLGGCLFDRVTTSMRIYREEIFGPVLCLVRARDFSEALGIVNGHEFGNGASIFTRDGNTAREFADRVQAGMVGVNVPIPVPLAFYSLVDGAVAFGDQNQHGMDGVRFFTAQDGDVAVARPSVGSGVHDADAEIGSLRQVSQNARQHFDQ
jgi:malonate-semialdehyde dehydrogenase (acetylating)/methylmalonate-semialdehyde dehydrogenase